MPEFNYNRYQIARLNGKSEKFLVRIEVPDTSQGTHWLTIDKDQLNRIADILAENG